MRSLLARLRESLEPFGLAPAEVLALLILLAGAASLTGVVWWTNQPPGAPQSGAPQSTSVPSAGLAPPPSDGGVPTPTPPEEVVVHVAGAVATPGLVTLDDGARVADAIDAAGGVLPEAVTEALNLARPVVDGEQIVVLIEGEAPPPEAAGPGDPAGGVLDLNTATPDQLEELPGVGPVMAARIIAHRDTLGGFADVTQLLEVPGIGPGRFAELEPLVRT